MKRLLVLVISLLLLTSCASVKNESIGNGKIKVVSSIIPFSSIVNYIGGDKVLVSTIVPAGVSPHVFDLKVKDMKEINNSDIIFSLGLEHIDGFLDKATGDKNVIKLVDGIELLHSEESHSHEEENHLDEDEYTDEEHSIDPHVWMGIENIKSIAFRIKEELIKISPKNNDLFEFNYNNFIKELDIIVSNYKRNVLLGEQQDFVIYHDAYNYLFESFGIEQEKKHVFKNAVGTNTKIWDIKMMLVEIIEQDIRIIFVDPQFNDIEIMNLAQDYYMESFILDPIGMDPSSSGYFDTLEKNLESLKNIYK